MKQPKKPPQLFPNKFLMIFSLLKRRFDTTEQVRKLIAVPKLTKKLFFQHTTFSTYDRRVYFIFEHHWREKKVFFLKNFFEGIFDLIFAVQYFDRGRSKNSKK